MVKDGKLLTDLTFEMKRSKNFMHFLCKQNHTSTCGNVLPIQTVAMIVYSILRSGGWLASQLLKEPRYRLSFG